MLTPSASHLLFALLSMCFISGCSGQPYYAWSSDAARRDVLEYCRIECEEERTKPPKPYRATFERAMTGDFAALHTVFADPDFHSGDNEAWLSMPWRLLQVVGDQRFAAFVTSQPVPERRKIMFYVPYIAPSDPRGSQAFEAHFIRKYPRTRTLWQQYQPPRPKASNQAMQRTASKPAINASGVCHPHFGCVPSCSGLAVADLVSR